MIIGWAVLALLALGTSQTFQAQVPEVLSQFIFITNVGFSQFSSGVFQDVNGDGLADYVVAYCQQDFKGCHPTSTINQIYINSGCGFVPAQSWNATTSYCKSVVSHLEKKSFLSAAEAAHLLGVWESVVVDALTAGELKGRKLAGSWVVHRASVDLWITGGSH